MLKKTILIAFALLILLSSCVVRNSSAMPMFARRIGRNCNYCHITFPKLNETGRIFNSNGYRFAGEGEWLRAKDIKTLPMAVEIEVEGLYNRIKKNNTWNEKSDIKLEEVEALASAALGKTGKVSVRASIGVAQKTNADGSTGYDAFAGGYIQINDLIGATGEGRLNIRAGQWEVALPFLSQARSIIGNKYLATRSLKVLALDQRAIEINGSILAEEETNELTHRYAVGITREDINADSKLKGFYATYSVTLRELYNLGLIYRRGKEKDGGRDIDSTRYGIASQAEAGPFILTLALFRRQREAHKDQNNIMGELFYLPTDNIILGARYDYLDEQTSSATARTVSFSARYNLLQNVFAQIEYSTLRDDDHIVGANEIERKGRLFLVALY